MIEKFEVSSTNVDSPVVFDSVRNLMIVTFLSNGAIYEYSDMTREEVEALTASGSVGSAIKRLRKPYERVG